MDTCSSQKQIHYNDPVTRSPCRSNPKDPVVTAPRCRFWQLILGLFICLLGGASGIQAQDTLSLQDFEGWENWPLYEPGDIDIDTGEFGSLITWFDARFGSESSITIRADIISDIYFKGEPAFWIQHTSSGSADNPDRSSTLDASLYNLNTFRVLLRIASQPGQRSWGGTYDITQHHPDKVYRIQVAENGSVIRDSLQVKDNNPFDFVTIPHLLSFMNLEQNQRFRLLNIGSRRSLSPRPVAMFVKGKTIYTDADGEEHEVWEVQLLNNAETLLISLFVTKEIPYFWGWQFRRVSNGQLGAEWIYKDHQVIEEKMQN